MMMNSRNNSQQHRHLNQFSSQNSDGKIKVGYTLSPADAQPVCSEQSRAFNGKFQQMWSRSLKNCNRRWNMALPAWSWRRSTIKAVAIRGGCGLAKAKVGWWKAELVVIDVFKMHTIFCLLIVWGPKNSNICVLRKWAKALAAKCPGELHQRVLLPPDSAPTHSQ